MNPKEQNRILNWILDRPDCTAQEISEEFGISWNEALELLVTAYEAADPEFDD